MTPPPDATCWTLIGAAAGGDPVARGDFARRYEPVARRYFGARWRGSPLRSSVEDAVQDSFLECFKSGGVLGKAADGPPEGFRAFFHGVLRNVARRLEERQRPMADLAAEPAADDTSLGHAFDRAWARSLLVESARLQGELAGNDERRRRRVELLRLRFHHGRAIREIAADWGVDAATLHHEYAAARAEFRQALLRVIAFQRPTATAAELDQAARELLKSLA